MQKRACLPTWSTEIAQIPLNHGLYAIIDATDFMAIARFHWTSRRSHSKVYACRKEHRKGKYRTIFMHLQLTNPGPFEEVHHKNLNSLDNRRSNLEPMTPAAHHALHTMDRITRKNQASTTPPLAASYEF